MKLTDIIELAKKGYTVSDIKELLSIPTEQTEDKTDEPEKVEEEVMKQKEDEPDYKALYTKTKEDLSNLQQQNINKDLSDPNKRTDEDIISDFVSTFM